MSTEPQTDTDDALDLLLQWPLILVILDGYEPRLAKIVMDTIKEQAEPTFTVLWNFASDNAHGSVSLN